MKDKNGQMEKGDYLAGDYSIADIAHYGWVSLAIEPLRAAAPEALGDTAALDRWLKVVSKRPATALS